MQEQPVRGRGLALVSSREIHESLCSLLPSLDAVISLAFEAADFLDILSRQTFDFLIVEAAAAGPRPAQLLARARRGAASVPVALLVDPSAPAPEEIPGVQVIPLPLTVRSLARAVAGLSGATAELEEMGVDGLIGDSAPMRALREKVRLFASSDATALVVGESGTGKERVARALHASSARANGPFVAVNCGSIPGEIVESELFGHLKGAFTGADRDRIGAFEAARGGTLFLDEVGTMRLDHQVRLLRVLQEQTITPVGSSRSIPVDVRVVAATNADLDTLIEAGRFREDLFYRLNVLLIAVPPLRDRREDIPALARHFTALSCRRQGLSAKTLTDGVIDRILSHAWRGNVRELENVIAHAIVVSQARGAIEIQDLPAGLSDRRRNGDRRALRLTSDGLDLNETVSRLERDMILQSLELAHGNKSRAAELLRLKRTTFVEKLRRYELLESDLTVSA